MSTTVEITSAPTSGVFRTGDIVQGVTSGRRCAKLVSISTPPSTPLLPSATRPSRGVTRRLR